MLSAGLLGGPAIGFKQDYFASQNLKEKAPAAYERYKAGNENSFAGFKTVGLDGAKVGILEDDGTELARAGKLMLTQGKKDENHDKLDSWWGLSKVEAKTDAPAVKEAGLFGGRMALKLTSYVPAAMAVIFLLLYIYFKSIGGYRPLTIDENA